MPTTRSIHEHKTVYLGDLALTVTGNESDVSLRRAELCMECGMLQVQFGSRWYEMKSDATRQFLVRFHGTQPGKCVDPPPAPFKIRAPTRSQQRLGRGLAEILNDAVKPKSLPGVDN